MPAVFGAVLRLRHRTEHDVVYDPAQRPARQPVQNFRIVGGAHVFGGKPRVDAHLTQVRFERRRPLLGRLFVDAVHEGQFVPRRKFGDRLVGEDHELFDDALRNAALARVDMHLAVRAERDVRLLYVEVDAAARLPPRRKFFRKLPHQLEHGHEGRVLLPQRRIAREDGVHSIIGHARA